MRVNGEAVPKIDCEACEVMMKYLEEKRTLSKWFAETANWFVLFVQTYKEQQVADSIQKKLNPEKYVVFCPTKDYAHNAKNQGKIAIPKIWLRGYVFIASTASPNECLAELKPLIVSNKHIYRFLSNDGSPDDIALSTYDKGIMSEILDENFNIPALEAISIEGSKVKIIGDALEGFGGRIVKVNQQRQTAIVEMKLFGREVAFEIMFRFIDKACEVN